MSITGLRMRVVGRDATPMRGFDSTGKREGADTSYETDTINIGPGESFDVIFVAPPHQGPGAYDTYMLFNRNFTRSNNLAPGGFGGQQPRFGCTQRGRPAELPERLGRSATR